jgi:ABC-type Fe3+-siderophore transport system permease subunit
VFSKKINVNNGQERALTVAQVAVLCILAVASMSVLIAAAFKFGDDSGFFTRMGAALAVAATVVAFILFRESLSDRRLIPIVFTLTGIAVGSAGYLVMSKHPLLGDILFGVAISLVLFFKFFRGQFIPK